MEDEVLLDDLPIVKELVPQVINTNYQNTDSSRNEGTSPNPISINVSP